MATSTTNLNLTLPSGNENVSRQTLNENFTKIDNAVGTLDETKYEKPETGIPAEDLAAGVIPDLSGYAPKSSPEFSGSISMGRRVGITKGSNSIAAGFACAAAGIYSNSFGYGTEANGAYQHVCGKYNLNDGPDTYEDWQPGKNYLKGSKVRALNDQTFNMEYWVCMISNSDSTFHPEKWDKIPGDGTLYAEIVGNGTSWKRSNARTVDWSGNEEIAGNMTAKGGTLTLGSGDNAVSITRAQLAALLALLN